MLAAMLVGLAHVLDIVLNLIKLVVILSVIISWLSADPYNQFVVMTRTITEPMYRPFRQFFSQFQLPIDLSPMIVLLIIVFLQTSLVPYLLSFGQRL